MKHAKWIRFLALFLLLAMAVGAIPAVLAANADASGSAEEPSVQEDSVQEDPAPEEQQETASESPTEQAKPDDASSEDTEGDDVPRSMDGETLTRDENLFPPSSAGTTPVLRSKGPLLRATAASAFIRLSKARRVELGMERSSRSVCAEATAFLARLALTKKLTRSLLLPVQ